MSAISSPSPKASENYLRAPSGAKTKLVRLGSSQLKLIERAAKKRNTSSSWYVVQAALRAATADLKA